MSKKMFSRERERDRERGKIRFSALLILIGLLLFGCDPTTVTITYNANGGEGEMKPQAVESGVEVKLIANTFTKDGSDFTGWNEAADGSGKAYADGATVTPTGNLTLYAQWQAKSTPENPGTEDPGTEDPDPENPGTEDPKPPVAKDNHITNLALIYVVEETYRQNNSGSEFGWTKTAEGYVDMTDETNKTLVEGVTSLGPNGDMYLDGIEYFTGLQVLILENNSVLTKLPDLTSLNSLRSLSVTSSSLTAVSDLPVSLETLNLNTNKLTTLNVSELTNLTYLDVSVNELTELDVDTNTKLTYLACFNNRMNELNITNVEAFSKTSSDPTPILACGLQEDAEGVLQALTLIGTQAQKDALALLIPAPNTDPEAVTELQKPNIGVVWNVPGAELDITAGTAVFNATSGLKLPFEVGNTGALTEEELTQLLASATKTVTLFTADNEAGTPVETGISHGVDGSTPYILVATAAFPQESETTYSEIKVVLQAEGYVTQTLIYQNVTVDLTGEPEPEQPGGEGTDPDQPEDVELQLTAGTAVFNKESGLTLSFGENQTLPEGAVASVSLGENEAASENVSVGETAVTVAPAALTNDTVGMTVTVTVSAEGYNKAVLTYEGVNTVWMPENVTAALEAVSPENTFIEGEVLTVTLTADGESTGKIKITSAAADGISDISFTDSTITVPNAEGGPVTLTLTLGKDGTEETVSAAVELAKIYNSTHVRYDGRIFQQVKGFDFSTENAAKNAGVTVKRGAGGTWAEKSNWETVTYSDGEGYTFTTNDGDGVRFVFPETDGDLDFDLIMVETKWNNSNANIHGYSFYKGGKSFFMLDSYNYAEGYGFNVDVTANTFNRFYAFDDGTNHSGRVNDGDVKSFSFSNTHTLDSSSSIQLEFNEGTSCTYTLRTVNFYKPLSN